MEPWVLVMRDADSKGALGLALKILSILLILATTGCAILDTDSSISLQLSDAKLTQRGASPYIYKLTTEGAGNAFVTAIRNCDINKKASAASLWRQLLVGMKEIQVDRQEQVELGGSPALLSVFRASIDGVAVRLACYTTATERCVTDYVIWSPSQDDDPDGFEEAISNFERYVSEQTPGAGTPASSHMVNRLTPSDNL